MASITTQRIARAVHAPAILIWVVPVGWEHAVGFASHDTFLAILTATLVLGNLVFFLTRRIVREHPG